MSRILILGTGNAQLDAVRLCKEHGLSVYTCSCIQYGPVCNAADFFELIDIADIERIKDYAVRNDIDLIYSVGSDIAMPTVSKVSEDLDLPRFVSYETAKICNNKVLLREFLGKDFTGNLRYQMVESTLVSLELEFPVIMKPVDSQGQRGVRLINSYNEFVDNFDDSVRFSRNGKLILEEYVDGPEISVNSYVVNGNIEFSIISDRISWPDYPGGIIHEHILPSNIAGPSPEKEIRDLVERTISRLGIENGPVYFQIKLKEGKPKLIEVTPRLDGCHIWRLIKEYNGIDLLKASFEHLTNPSFKMGKPKSVKSKRVKLEFFSEKPGMVFDRSKYVIDNPKYLEWYYEKGEIVRSINGHFEKTGYQISNL